MSNRDNSYFRYQDRNFGGRPPRYFYSVPCPTCRAIPGDHCRTSSGLWNNPHSERVQRVKRIDSYKEDET